MGAAQLPATAPNRAERFHVGFLDCDVTDRRLVLTDGAEYSFEDDLPVRS